MSVSGRGRIRANSAQRTVQLSSGWMMAEASPGAIGSPDALAGAGLSWLPVDVPSTVASALRRAGLWSLDGAPRRFDASDWWFRTTFRTEPKEVGDELWLALDGIATIAEVWLNGARILEVAGMFTAHEERIDDLADGEHALVICCRSLDAALAARRARPRWRVPMLEQQQLRWHRTSLLGRTPGWSPPVAPVGPWRGVRLEYRRGVRLTDVRLDARGDGRLIASCGALARDGSPATDVVLHLAGTGRTYSIPLVPGGEDGRFAADVRLDGVARWFPHTHGESPLYDARLEVTHHSGDSEISLGALGFRSVSRTGGRDAFALAINDVPVFARGACWTPIDPVALDASDEALTAAMRQLVDGGMNMLRVGGTMVYESDAFLDACDAHGIMLWQDFMFANMDYPEDEAFTRLVEIEARQQLARWQGRPSLTVLCGNSEGEQQAAMWGAERSRWLAPLFRERLATLCSEWSPGAPYVASSATEGDFPHQSNAGPSSYYGVGAYLRDVDDARRAEVRFASECLAFANVPSVDSMAKSPVLRGARVHHSAWKSRTPRDLGAGWDFDDVRDHYFARLFGVDALAVRYADHERYLELGRVVTGEIMSRVFTEWRRRRSVTRGGLVWFLRDLRDGAGWGLVDASGEPKPAWHFVRRALAPIAVGMTDEGTNGLALHVVNDRPSTLHAVLELGLYRDGAERLEGVHREISVAPHESVEYNAAGLLDRFIDVNQAYRFGPASHDLVVATLRNAEGGVISQALHLPNGWPAARERDVGLTASVERQDEDTYLLAVESQRVALAVRVEVPGFGCGDDYFHVVPGIGRTLLLRRTSGNAPPRGALHPLNCATPSRVSLAD